MKVSAILLSILVSWVVAYPSLLDWQKDADKLMGNVATKGENGAHESNLKKRQTTDEEKPQGLIETIRFLQNKLFPRNVLDSGKSEDSGIINLLRGHNNGKHEAPIFPLALIFGKDNLLNSIFSNAAATAGRVMDRIKSNFERENGFPLLTNGKKLAEGVIWGTGKRDSDRLNGHESSGNDNSQVPTEVDRTSTKVEKEGHTYSYQESAEGGAKEVASEKHAIHSSSSLTSSRGDAKTSDKQKTASGDSWV